MPAPLPHYSNWCPTFPVAICSPAECWPMLLWGYRAPTPPSSRAGARKRWWAVRWRCCGTGRRSQANGAGSWNLCAIGDYRTGLTIRVFVVSKMFLSAVTSGLRTCHCSPHWPGRRLGGRSGTGLHVAVRHGRNSFPISSFPIDANFLTSRPDCPNLRPNSGCDFWGVACWMGRQTDMKFEHIIIDIIMYYYYYYYRVLLSVVLAFDNRYLWAFSFFTIKSYISVCKMYKHKSPNINIFLPFTRFCTFYCIYVAISVSSINVRFFWNCFWFDNNNHL